jgi:hypothetical protein
MSRLTDRLFEIEMDLASNDGDDESAALSRRIVLRKALTEWGDERFHEGYHEGRRDAADARLEAQRRADKAANHVKPQLCPTPCVADCEPGSLACHERHKPASERTHDPDRCEADA